MHNVVFLGTKSIGFDCLEYLINDSQKLEVNILGVLTKENKLDTVEKSISKLCELNDISLWESLDDLLNEEQEIDYLISVQYHKILDPVHIAKAKKLSINLHMAPLPEYRGCNQFSYAIIDGKKTFGTTIHLIDENIDSGDILFEKRFPIPPDCYVGELYKMTLHHSRTLFEESMPKILSNDIQPIKQQSLIKERGVSIHYRKEIEKLKQLDLDWSAEKIKRYIRATYFPPFSPPYFMVNEEKFYVKK